MPKPCSPPANLLFLHSPRHPRPTQMLLGHLRVGPTHPKRRWWALAHHNLGRAAVLLAWANVYIGIYMYHTSIFAASYTPWITPIAIVMGLLVGGTA